MYEKIMKVFYGEDCLPYKDKERTVHFPITGGAFLGASNTTQIRFYIDQIGDYTDTWVANSKLPNGKMGNKILSYGNDTELGEHYVYLDLSSFYTQAKGDLYISLNGFYGGVTITEDNGQYSIDGIPTIQATGVIKIAINYATPLIDGEEEEIVTLAQIYAELGKKLDKSDSRYLKVVNGNMSQINTSTYEGFVSAGDIVYNYGSGDEGYPTNKFWVIGGTYPSLTYGEIKFKFANLDIETTLNVRNINIGDFANFKNGSNQTITDYFNGVISSGYVNLSTDQTISGHKTFSTTITANNGVNFGNGANVNMYNGYILNNRTKLFGIGTSTDNRTYYQFPYGSVSGSTHNENNPYTIATEEYVSDYAYSKSQVYTKSEIDSKYTSALVYKGSKTVSELNTLGSSLGIDQTGWFYNVSNDGVLTLGNIEVFAGDNVCWTGSGWDKLTMDLSAYDDKFIAAGFFEVQNYNENTGEITFVYSSDLYSMSYNSSTGVLTIEAN